MKKFCECGCRTQINPNIRFVSGHNRRGCKCSAESVQKMRDGLKLRWKDPNSKYNSSEYRLYTKTRSLGKKRGPMSTEQKNKISRTMIGIQYSNEWKEKQRQRLLNGHASYMNKFIKNPSKPEIKLRDIVKELYPTCEFQYQIFNYSLDVAIPEYKIAIEYDGWFHFDCQEHIDYHIDRQQRIEGEGWIFIKYTMYDKFPSKEKIEEDINSLLRRNQCQR
jgi:very-short-patch-repair endonuclease